MAKQIFDWSKVEVFQFGRYPEELLFMCNNLSAPLPGGKGAESHSNRWYKAIPTYPVHHGQHPTRQPLCRLLTGKPILTYIGTGVGGLGIVFSIPTFIKIHKAGVIQSDF